MNVRWRHAPNVLTALRVLLVPVVAALVLADTDAARWGACAVFVIAALTDIADGRLARRNGGVTRFGELVDPLADKLLVGVALVLLAALGEVAWWIAVVILAREAAVTLLRARLVTRRRLVMPASAWGKAKTLAQVIAIAIALAPVGRGWPGTAALLVAVALTVWSGIEYGFRAARLVRAAAAPAADGAAGA